MFLIPPLKLEKEIHVCMKPILQQDPHLPIRREYLNKFKKGSKIYV